MSILDNVGQRQSPWPVSGSGATKEILMAASDARVRARLAITIVSISLAGVTIASAVALALADRQGRAEMARLVFASVLPLFGTWIGTVLAFYFARENLQAATDATQRLQGLQPHTPVRDVMIPRTRMIVHAMAAGVDVTTVRLADLYHEMITKGVSRLPILSDTDAVRYVVHQSTIDRFAATPPAVEPMALTQTVNDLLANPEFAKPIAAIAFVGPNAVVQEARTAMRALEGCNDVFVTASGRTDDRVIGWLTNTDLAGTD